MAKFEIRLKEKAKNKLANKINYPLFNPGFGDYDFLVDGREISLLTGVDLSFNVDSYPEVKLSFLVDNLDIDPELGNFNIVQSNAEGDEK